MYRHAAARRRTKHQAMLPFRRSRPSAEKEQVTNNVAYLPVELAVVDHRQAPQRLDGLHSPACRTKHTSSVTEGAFGWLNRKAFWVLR